MNKFGKKIKKLRGQESIRKAAKGIGISHTYLDSLEKGFDPRTGKERKPTWEVINKIAKYYNYDFVELVDLANLFKSPNELNDEELKHQIKKMKKSIKSQKSTMKNTIKSQILDLLEEDISFSQTTYFKNALDFFMLEKDSPNKSEDPRSNNILVIAGLLHLLVENKDSQSKEAYFDLTNEFNEFVKRYLDIEKGD
ncbi:helix-turn-helix domain-containing protein [Staphylococcus pettenkoferi]|uniref:helix-turn-helix domain-containing protein n=1 Tax=Staphylococcus pettenkoferi TaxID=170573 RepID=UPI00069F4411|nr:helix-turn-helix transcriptional regulator [Staphylococcus pettenkoferi]MCY1604735.1 helix-turn-helix domain-containing protein [Staphylococcus pettenkoferi]